MYARIAYTVSQPMFKCLAALGYDHLLILYFYAISTTQEAACLID